jgi:protein-tyrosine phosphatase
MYWVRKYIIGGSEIPYTENDIIEWIDNGVKRVLVLAEDWEIEEVWGIKDYYFKVLEELGLEFYNEPIPDGQAPDIDQLIRIMKWLKSGKGNLVHCLAGLGRTGTIIASYLMLTENLDSSQAIEEVRRYKPSAIQTYSQELFLIKLDNMVKHGWFKNL